LPLHFFSNREIPTDRFTEVVKAFFEFLGGSWMHTPREGPHVLEFVAFQHSKTEAHR